MTRAGEQLRHFTAYDQVSTLHAPVRSENFSHAPAVMGYTENTKRSCGPEVEWRTKNKSGRGVADS